MKIYFPSCFRDIFVHLFIYLFIPYVWSLPYVRNWEYQNEYIFISVLKKVPVEWRRWTKEENSTFGSPCSSDGIELKTCC